MIRRIALLTAGMLLVSGLAFAQNTATANATVQILEELTIINDTQLDFGLLGINAAGDYSVSAANVPTGATVTQFGTTAPASFTVSGGAARPFNLSVGSVAATLGNGTDTITFTTGNSFASCTACTLDGAGDATVTVGGRISLTVGLSAGTYNAPTMNAFTVTVAY